MSNNQTGHDNRFQKTINFTHHIPKEQIIIQENVWTFIPIDEANIFAIYSRGYQLICVLLLAPYNQSELAINPDTWSYLINSVCASTKMYSCTFPRKIINFNIFKEEIIWNNKLVEFRELAMKLNQEEKYFLHQLKLKCSGFPLGSLEFHNLVYNLKKKLIMIEQKIEKTYIKLLKINQQTHSQEFDATIEKLVVKIKKIERIQF